MPTIRNRVFPANRAVAMPRKGQRHVVRHIADMASFFCPAQESRQVLDNATRIGILAQWGIGDAVLCLPLIQGLKEAYPHASIDLIGKPWLTDLFSGEPAVNGVRLLVPPWTKYSGKYRLWEKDWKTYARQLMALRRERYDLLISPRFDVRDNFQLRLLHAGGKAGFASAGGRYWISRDLGLDLDEHNALHRSEVAAEILKTLTGLVRSPIPRLTVPDEFRLKALERLRATGYTGGPIVAVHGGAGRALRRWNGDRFSEVLAGSLPADAFTVVIADSDGPDGYGIRRSPGGPSTLWRSSLAELIGLLASADVLLCADSGVMHMAAACGCRVVTVFGPTSPEWFGPMGEGHRVVKVDPMPCRPCFDACIYASPLCMDSIRETDVAAALQTTLSDIKHPRLESQGHPA